MIRDIIIVVCLLITCAIPFGGLLLIKQGEIKERNDIRNQFILDSIKVRRMVEKEYEFRNMPDSLKLKILKQEMGLK